MAYIQPPQSYDQYGNPKYFSYGRAGQKENPNFGQVPHSSPRLRSRAYYGFQKFIGLGGQVLGGLASAIPGVGMGIETGLNVLTDILNKHDQNYQMEKLTKKMQIEQDLNPQQEPQGL